MAVQVSRLRGVAVAFALALSAMAGWSLQPVAAFCTDAMTRWATGYASSTPRVHWNPSLSQRSAISAAVADWNGIDTIAYPAPVFNTSTYGNFDMYFSSFAGLGWPDLPGVTFNNSNSQPHTVSDLYLNNDYFWYTDGTMSQSQHKADIRTVMTHEVGHASGLAETTAVIFDCRPVSTSEIQGVMYSNWTKKWDTRADDIAGIQYIYP
jgi:hypothetical protein